MIKVKTTKQTKGEKKVIRTIADEEKKTRK